MVFYKLRNDKCLKKAEEKLKHGDSGMHDANELKEMEVKFTTHSCKNSPRPWTQARGRRTGATACADRPHWPVQMSITINTPRHSIQPPPSLAFYRSGSVRGLFQGVHLLRHRAGQPLDLLSSVSMVSRRRSGGSIS